MAVGRLTKRTPAPTAEGVRRSASEGLRVMRSTLFEQFATAKRRGDTEGLAVLAREIRSNITDDAKLHGAFAPQRTEVDVTVSQSATAILDRAEADLLALTERRPRSQVIEGEVIA